MYEQLRRSDADDTVLWNPDGDVTETTTANVVAEIGGALVTPPVEAGLLAGTLRAEMLRLPYDQYVGKADENERSSPRYR